MPKPNAYLLKKQAQERAKNQYLIKCAIYRDCSLWMLALNREYNFGKDRLNHLRNVVAKMYEEYVDAAKTDFEYGDEFIDREIRKILGEDFKLEI